MIVLWTTWETESRPYFLFWSFDRETISRCISTFKICTMPSAASYKHVFEWFTFYDLLKLQNPFSQLRVHSIVTSNGSLSLGKLIVAPLRSETVEVHYRPYKSILLDIVLSQLNPILILIFYLSFKIFFFKIILLSICRSPNCSFTLRFFDQNVRISNFFHCFCLTHRISLNVLAYKY